jgi:hypothetical protein
VKGGKTHIAFVEDPTGYKFELIQREAESPEPFAQVMLRVSNLDKSIKYYEDCLGMKLLRKRENPGARPKTHGTHRLSWCLRLTLVTVMLDYHRGTSQHGHAARFPSSQCRICAAAVSRHAMLVCCSRT